MYHLSRNSKNTKTGAMAVSTSENTTCPDSCVLKGNGCYAETGHLSIHWRKVSQGQRGLSWEDFLIEVANLPHNTVWRHNQAGDLPGKGDYLDIDMLNELVKANIGKQGFTYTHKPLSTSKERDAIRQANSNGFTINLSANNLSQADELASLKIAPVVVVVEKFTDMPSATPNGNVLVKCPSQTNDLTCKQCQLCLQADRKSIVAFEVHGVMKKIAAKAVKQ